MAAPFLRRVSSHLARLPRPFLPSASLENSFALGPLPEAPPLPGFPSVGSMELMAVPKKKVSRHKKGIRNGPKALKPVPVIVRCRSCGRVKLPHFYCCSGERGTDDCVTGTLLSQGVDWVPALSQFYRKFYRKYHFHE